MKLNDIGYFFIIILFLASCGKEIDGPATLPPGFIGPTGSTGSTGPTGPTGPNSPYGTLKIYLTWIDYNNYCDSIPVKINDTLSGYLSKVFSFDPQCGEFGTITLDSLLPASYKIYVGPCENVFWELNMAVQKGKCISIPLNK